MMAFMGLLLHPRTKKHLTSFINDPSHALAVIGPSGSGKLMVARGIAVALLGLPSIKESRKYPYLTHVKRLDGKQDIPIDSVRSITKLLKLKVPGDKAIRRIVVIEDAQDLNEEAQNAMLKMLEEPAPDCVFILTVSSTESLLPTIISRTQKLDVQPTALKDALDYFGNNFPHKQIESAWNLSQGCVGLLLAILRDDKKHPLKIAIDNAKEYLKKSKYERLLLADSLSKDKKQLALFLEALLKLLSALHHAVVTRGSKSQQAKILASRKLAYKLQEALDANASPKLITLELALNLTV